MRANAKSIVLGVALLTAGASFNGWWYSWTVGREIRAVSTKLDQLIEAQTSAAPLLEGQKGAIERLLAGQRESTDRLLAAMEQSNKRLLAALEQSTDRLLAAQEQSTERLLTAQEQSTERLLAAQEQSTQRLLAAQEQSTERLLAATDRVLGRLDRIEETLGAIREDQIRILERRPDAEEPTE